ncbi:MAG: single-stranded DNA-binding protein [Chitinophagales bacterium]|nr:single-stranded DNA-binding protein [Chitinophagales bacterium]
MSGINKVILIGNLGKDPELRNFEGGNVVANFTLATTEVYRDRNQNKVEHTEWHNIAMWGKLADIASKLLRKGSKVYIEGRIKSRSWEDKEGNKKYATDIIAENFTLLDKKVTTDNNQHEEAMHHEAGASVVSRETQMADDLPF